MQSVLIGRLIQHDVARSDPWIPNGPVSREMHGRQGARRRQGCQPASLRDASIRFGLGELPKPLVPPDLPLVLEPRPRPVAGGKEGRPPKPRAWLRGAVAIGRPDD